MKVNKNVTFDFQHFQVINSLLEKNHSKTFSGALRVLLDRAIKNEYVIQRLEKDLYSSQEDCNMWKQRAEAHLNPKEVLKLGTSIRDIQKENYKPV